MLCSPSLLQSLRHHSTRKLISQLTISEPPSDLDFNFFPDSVEELYSRVLHPSSIEDQLQAFESLEKHLSNQLDGFERFGDFPICQILVNSLAIESLQINASWILCHCVFLFPSYFTWLFDLGAVDFLFEYLQLNPPPISFLYLTAEIVENCEFDNLFIQLIPRIIEMISNETGNDFLAICLRILSNLIREDSVRNLCFELRLPHILSSRKLNFGETATDLAFQILIQCECLDEDFLDWALSAIHSGIIGKYVTRFIQNLQCQSFLKLSQTGIINELIELTESGSGLTKRRLGAVLFAFLKAMFENNQEEVDCCTRAFEVAIDCLGILSSEDALDSLSLIASLMEDVNSAYLTIAIESDLKEVLSDLLQHEDGRIARRADTLLKGYFCEKSRDWGFLE
jgi:hypothetical protein